MSLRRGGVFALALAAVLATASPGVFGQEDVWVDANDCDNGMGVLGSVDNPYCLIQDAICYLKDQPGGGTANVRPGTYTEAIRMFSDVSVVSTDGPSVTTIDATGQYCRFVDCTLSGVTPCTAVYYPTASANNADVFSGFRVTGGGGLNQTCGGSCDIQAGAGIYILNSSPTITNTEVVNNTLVGSANSFYGAGIYIMSGTAASPATPIITNTLVEGNVNNSPPGQNQNNLSFSLGGGIYVGFNAAPVIDSSTIRLNTSGDFGTSNQVSGGAGIGIYTQEAVAGTPVISKTVIASNSTAGRGGGISVWYGEISLAPSKALIENNLIEYNDGVDGGGLAARWSLATFRNNTVVNNISGTGGGISIYDTGDPLDQVTFINNIVSLNTSTNYGGGVYVSLAEPVVRHNDVFGNTPEEVGGDKSDVDYIGLEGNISADPMFVSTSVDTRDLRLQPASPAIEAGDNAETGNEDFDVVPRIQDGDFDAVATVDMGAYEFSPDFDGDNVPDWQDDDDDNDGVLDSVDCADFVASLSSLPGDVPATLTVDDIGGGVQVRWDFGWQGFTSNVYRGVIDGSAFTFNDTCVFSEKPGRTLVDNDDPNIHEAYYYLVAAKNACGESFSTGGVSAPFPCVTMGRETDGDGILDLEDNCAGVSNALQVDADADFVGDLCDNCVNLANPAQGDRDEDTFGDLCDCGPDDPALGATLATVGGVVVHPGANTMITWDNAGAGMEYDVASGAISDLRFDMGPSAASCVADSIDTMSWQDGQADPVSGDGYYYLIRTQTPTCDGSYGLNSQAEDRSLPAACL